MQSGNPESPPKPPARVPTPLDSPSVEGTTDKTRDDIAARSARLAHRALRIPSDGAPHASDDTNPGASLPPVDDPTVLQTLPRNSLAPVAEQSQSPWQAQWQSPAPKVSSLDDNNASMRVVRRRIRKVSGETDAPPPLDVKTAPEPVHIAPAPVRGARPQRAVELKAAVAAVPPPPPPPPPPPVSAVVQSVVQSAVQSAVQSVVQAPGAAHVLDPTHPSWPEVEVSDDFEVPAIDDEPTREIELALPSQKPRSVPPPPPVALAVRPSPIVPSPAVSAVTAAPVPTTTAPAALAEPGATQQAPTTRTHDRTVPDLSVMSLADGPMLTAPELHDDDGVEISIDDIPELVSEARRSDPSLALLDALAELPPDSTVIEDPRSSAPKASLQPPPPPEAARGPRASGSQSSNRATAVTLPERNKRRKLWWEELFGEDYLRTMEQFTPAQTQTEADWIEQALGVEAGASILDVACGAGRQAAALAGRGYDVVALDYSLAMLSRASEVAQERSVKVSFKQQDMCAMDFTEVFDAAYCVGTSFGFFDDEKNAEVAHKIHRALKPHGTFLLGVVNRDHVIQRQPGMAWFEGDGCVCMEETSFNFITSRLNVKRTVIFEDGRQRETEYSIRLYSLHELGQVLHTAGFRILEVSGNPRTPAAFFGPSSRELIILAQKRGTEVVEISSLATGPYDAQRGEGP